MALDSAYPCYVLLRMFVLYISILLTMSSCVLWPPDSAAPAYYCLYEEAYPELKRAKFLSAWGWTCIAALAESLGFGAFYRRRAARPA